MTTKVIVMHFLMMDLVYLYENYVRIRIYVYHPTYRWEGNQKTF